MREGIKIPAANYRNTFITAIIIVGILIGASALSYYDTYKHETPSVLSVDRN